MRELLDRYWKCETTPEEESILREWLTGNDVPEDLKNISQGFQALDCYKELKAPATIKQNGLKILPTIQLYPLLKIAASILIVISAGIGTYTHYSQEKFLKEVFSETYSDPQDAIKETEQILGKISSSLSEMKDSIGVQEDGVIMLDDTLDDFKQNITEELQ